MKTTIKEKEEIILINMDNIRIPRLAMRQTFSSNSVMSLAESIRRIGLINPITVKADGLNYEIIAGHRRYSAVKLLRWNEIPAIVKKPAGLEELSIRYDENSERAAVDVIEEAEYLATALHEHSLTQAALAARIGKQPAYVSERLAILEYHPQILAALKSAAITFSVAREFAKVTDVDAMLQYLGYAISNGCTPATARLWRKQAAATKEWRDESADTDDTATEEPDTTPTIPVRLCQVCDTPTQAPDLRPIWCCPDCYKAALSREA